MHKNNLTSNIRVETNRYKKGAVEPDKLLAKSMCDTVGIHQRILQVSSAVPLYHSLVTSLRVVRGRVEW